ncbi:hypothetical protein C1646_752544 [Rhizophagus diaphanus]|nr:hypothetical protein C1646_752544 [Rhizophagus diaphanus] [Rhizophagus sp. MUCL 43196]
MSNINIKLNLSNYQGGLMMNNQIKILKRLQDTYSNISFSFNIKQKNHNKNTKKGKNIQINPKKSTNINIDIEDNVTLDDTFSTCDKDDQVTNIQDSHNFPLYSDLIHDYKQIKIATHNIQGGFNKKKKDDIIQLMILENMDFLHVCETNKREQL